MQTCAYQMFAKLPCMNFENFSTIAQIIELAVAPAFLLMAVGSLINVATIRLGRVIDRARILEAIIGEHRDEKNELRYMDELKTLGRRMSSINISIMFATFAALLVCCVVALIFISALLSINAPLIIALLFIATMIMMIIGLLFFLSEIFIATSTIRVHTEYFQD